MRPLKLPLLSLLLLASFSRLALAELHDTGPMGPAASGAPTPDAAVLSEMRLPAVATPAPSSTTVTARIARNATKKGRAHARWEQIQALHQRISAESKAGRIYSRRAEALHGELDAIQARYHFRMELEGAALSKSQDQALEVELKALDLKVTGSLVN